MRTIEDFAEIVIGDSEYYHEIGTGDHSPPVPVCFCAVELRSGQEHRLWQDELQRPSPPWSADGLFVSYNLTAELGCYAQLGWPFPRFALDLLIEHRQIVNGVLPKEHRRDLLNALRYYGLPAMQAVEKEHWRDVVLAGPPYSPEQIEVSRCIAGPT